MIQHRFCMTLLACCLAFACKEKAAEPTPTEAPAPPALPAAIEPAAPAFDPKKAVVPTSEDFEAEAEQTISSKNLNEELDKLEREIGAPP